MSDLKAGEKQSWREYVTNAAADGGRAGAAAAPRPRRATPRAPRRPAPAAAGPARRRASHRAAGGSSRRARRSRRSPQAASRPQQPLPQDMVGVAQPALRNDHVPVRDDYARGEHLAVLGSEHRSKIAAAAAAFAGKHGQAAMPHLTGSAPPRAGSRFMPRDKAAPKAVSNHVPKFGERKHWGRQG